MVNIEKILLTPCGKIHTGGGLVWHYGQTIGTNLII